MLITLRVKLVSTLLTVTAAPGTREPDASKMTPVRLAVTSWAAAGNTRPQRAKNSTIGAFRFMISSLRDQLDHNGPAVSSRAALSCLPVTIWGITPDGRGESRRRA